MTININLKLFLKKATLFISLLLFLNLIDVFFRIYLGYDGVLSKLFKYFNFDEETSFPTLYSFVALFTSALLLFLIFIKENKNKKKSYKWLGLFLIFVFLAFDEVLQLHEKLSWMVQRYLNTDGILLFAWVIPYFIGTILVFLIYFRFLMGLDKKTRNLFILSGTIFVIGAIGFELVESSIFAKNPNLTFNYYLLASCEEFLEMFGVNLFIYALLFYLKINARTLNINLI